MDKQLTLGSLFSGSGGFELGATLCGIRPVWNSEVEPFAIAVTKKHFLDVLHLGDINRIDGAAIPPVDIITGGFCCQDLSVAGRRAGLHGERSGLFFQVIRIIREMRQATAGKYPRFAVLENVPGIYSSNQGLDFLEVLNELANIKQDGNPQGEAVSIPMPESGKWLGAGEILGDDYAIAYRTFDAQHWGVAQRRRRCYIVVDFTGECAGEILFNESRLSGHPPQGAGSWQGAAGGAADRPGNPGRRTVLNDQGGRRMDVSEDVVGTLRAEDRGHHPCVIQAAGFCTEHSAKSRGVGFEDEKSPTLRAGVVPGAVVYDARGNGDGHIANTLAGDHENQVTDYTALAVEPRAFGIGSYHSRGMLSDNPHSGFYEAETARTLDTSVPDPNKNAGGMAIVAFAQNQRDEVRDLHDCAGALAAEPGMKQQTFVAQEKTTAFAMTTGSFSQVHEEQAATLMARDYKDPQTAFVPQAVNEPRYLVRRLIPAECAMLQGFPSDWCTGLETPEPSEEDIAFWTEVFETHARINGKKPRSRNQIIKWLQSPHTDSAEYKLWGNGCALPNIVYVLGGIVYYTQFSAPEQP
ncbi:DNA cytosine methyltransferase [Eubacteriales bacterium OttesenSCG-928-A19]|nr:DNA cytosine methyltransferase [Eubacteriales bacterium OttesenSCG-928-A19]